MTQVFLDGQEVVVQNKTSIKLIKENPFFTKSGSSTLGITLPMHIEQNLKVLGHLNRLDNLTTPITLSATIKSGNKTIITGEAVVTEITEKSVKVQILGGTAGGAQVGTGVVQGQHDFLALDGIDIVGGDVIEDTVGIAVEAPASEVTQGHDIAITQQDLVSGSTPALGSEGVLVVDIVVQVAVAAPELIHKT